MSCIKVEKTTNLFSLGELRMNELPIKDAGAVGCRGQQPQHKHYLQFIVKWQPVTAITSTTAVNCMGYNEPIMK